MPALPWLDIALRRANEASRAPTPGAEAGTGVVVGAGTGADVFAGVAPVFISAALPPEDMALRLSITNARVLFAGCDIVQYAFAVGLLI